MTLALELLLILICLFYGARKGGVALGLLGGIGVVVLVFGFHVSLLQNSPAQVAAPQHSP
ncbi:anaerobic C4-dicarboxylate transporter family protein, partial [Accumulibacter sp.]|uniref:anaerobic C4-dicarboxylate transporter family protein n=1 Tax=Accumulibacter sp. TaxID=2053492 RepID=UPI0028784FBE